MLFPLKFRQRKEIMIEENLLDIRYSKEDQDFHAGIEKILNMDIEKIDLIHQFPLFTGHVNLARFLSLYEAFRMVKDLNGHYADVGTWKGTSFLFIAKLIKIFEPYGFTQVHAFDWFQGMEPSNAEKQRNYIGDYDTLIKLVKIQNLSDIALVHKLDLTKELKSFFTNPLFSGTKFKYIFLDCGIKTVLEECIPYFWPRLVKGGIIIFDHYGTDIGSETQVVDSLIKGQTIKTFSYSRQPTAYIIKE